MLLECSGVGATVQLDRLPVPPGAPAWRDTSAEATAWRLRWLGAFPSFGYVLAVRPQAVARVMARFAERDIGCADVGSVDAGHSLRVQWGQDGQTLWDLAVEPFIGATPATNRRQPALAA